MRRKPFSFIFIGVLATFSLANTAYGFAVSLAEDCQCHARSPTGYGGPPIIVNTQPNEVFSQFSHEAQKQITSELVAIHNHKYTGPVSYFGDDPVVLVKNRRCEESAPAEVRVHYNAVNKYGEPLSTRVRRHHKVRGHHKVIREYEEYQPAQARSHRRVVSHYQAPLSTPERKFGKTAHNRSQVLSLESPKYVMHRPHQRQNANYPDKIIRVAPFRHIVAGSDINIVLKNSDKPCIQVLSRDCCGRRLIGYSVKNGTLYLCDLTKRACETYTDPNPNTKACQVTTRPLQVIISSNCVESIRLLEHASIYAPNYHTTKMAVKSYTTGTIMLHGELHPYNIEQYGSGYIYIGDVYAKNLDITSQGPGLIRLAGRVDALHVRGLVNSHIDAKFLRARDAWVSTSGYSEVAVTADNALDSYSTGSSFVYYYKTPQFYQPLTFEHANVMQMAYWN